MKLSIPDLLLMHRSFLAICASVLASAIALYSSGEYMKHVQKERQRSSRNHLNAARNQLSAAYDDQKNMAAYSNEYATLLEHKIIGDEQRLDWMEGMEKIRRQNLVMNFHYSIAPQKTYSAKPPMDSGNFDVRYSEMKLQFELLHEAQLLDFFAALRSQIKGRYQLEGCTLQRTGTDSVDEPTAQLKAECSGGWITLKNRNAPK